MEQKHSQLAEDTDGELVKRRVALTNAYQALPAYGSDSFWHMIEEPDLKIALSLEVLVKCACVAIASGDDRGHIIDTATIPKEACKRLAKALQQPLFTIETFLGLDERKHLTPGLAEGPAAYRVEVQSNVQLQSMRLSNEQKDAWRAILAEDG